MGIFEECIPLFHDESLSLDLLCSFLIAILVREA